MAWAALSSREYCLDTSPPETRGLGRAGFCIACSLLFLAALITGREDFGSSRRMAIRTAPGRGGTSRSRTLNQVKDGRPLRHDDAVSAADCPHPMPAHRPLPLNRVPLPPWVALAKLCLAAGVLGLAAAQAAAHDDAGPRALPGVRADREPALIRMVRQDCGSCHGMQLTGGLGPPLTREVLADKPVAGLAATIYAGRPGTPMPPWRALLSEAESTWIAEQLLRGFPDEPRRQTR